MDDSISKTALKWDRLVVFRGCVEGGREVGVVIKGARGLGLRTYPGSSCVEFHTHTVPWSWGELSKVVTVTMSAS